MKLFENYLKPLKEVSIIAKETLMDEKKLQSTEDTQVSILTL